MVTPNSADLLYKAHFTSVAYVGNSTVLESTFEDLGYTSIGVTNLKVSLDFGLYEHNDTKDGCVSFNGGPCISHPFVTIQPFEQSTFALTIQIPNGTTVGSHLVTATVSWALGPSNFWPSSELYLVTHGYLVVYSQPVNPSPNSPTNIQNGFLRLLAPILGGSATIAVLTVGLVVWNAKRSEKRNQAMLQYVASAKQSLTQKTCSNCGAPAGFQDKFCGNCGHMIS
jgi:hypothetical protein